MNATPVAKTSECCRTDPMYVYLGDRDVHARGLEHLFLRLLHDLVHTWVQKRKHGVKRKIQKKKRGVRQVP